MPGRRLSPQRSGKAGTRHALALGLACLLLAAATTTAEAAGWPLHRWLYFYEPRAYPFESPPAAALRSAREDYDRKWGSPDLQMGPAIEGTAWIAIGPDRIPPGGFMDSAGRATAIAIDPRNRNIVYVAGAQGGVWKTANRGTTWTPLTDRECSLAMAALALDPVDPDIVYAGTGEPHFSGDSYYGCGVLRSTNAGATWTQLGAAVFDTATGGARISRVVIDPTTAGSTTSTTLYVASDFGVHKSSDRGATWTRVLTGVATDLVIDPSNPSVLYAAVGNVVTDTRNGVYKSTNRGASWTRLTTGLPTADVGRINLTIFSSDPRILFATIQNDFGGSGVSGSLLGIFKTTDGGASWTQVAATGATCGSNNQCWYDMIVAVHPTNANIVYFGAVDLFKSTNGGASFSRIMGGSIPIHVDHHAFAFDPQDPSVIYVANDGGIYRSADAGATWSSLNTNLAITQFYPGISLHPTDASVALGGTQDNGTLLYSGTTVWQQLFGGDGGYTAFDPTTPSTRYAETQWAANSSFSGPRRSDNGGAFVRKVNGIDLSDRALFIPPLVMDPSNSSRLYFGTFRLYRTTDRGESWTAISPDLSNGAGRISSIAVARGDSQVIYVGTSDGNVQVTIDGGATWTRRITGLPNRFVTWIAVNPGAPETAWATVSGFGSGHVFKTTNSGATWQDISGNLPDVPVNVILIDPGATTNLYLGTDLGVFRSTTGGETWSPFNSGLPNVAVFDLAFNAGTGVLLAATHGRGMFKISVAGTAVLGVTPRSRDFGTVAVGNIADLTFTVENFGQGTLSAQASATAPFSIVSGSSLSLGPGATQNVVVRFTPTTTGSHASNINFTSNGGSISALVTGRGTSGSFRLTVTKSGNGTVTSSPSGINCGANCSATFPGGTSVVLTATTSSGSTWSGWSGSACSGTVTTTCAVTLTADASVTASFATASAPPAMLGNISTRGRIESGDNVMIGGFIISGSSAKTVLIRARGPSMGDPPFRVPGVLADPILRLFSGQTVIAQNDDWRVTESLCRAPAQGCGNAEQIRATGLHPCQPNPGQPSAPTNCDLESALLVTLPPGAYTAIVCSFGGGRLADGTLACGSRSGVGIVEVFDVSPSSPARLANISTRGRVQTADDVMIGGFIVSGSSAKRVLVRARGPSMGDPPFRVPGVLGNPMLRLFSGQTVIAQNDDWRATESLCRAPAEGCGDEAQIRATGLDPCQPNPGQPSAPTGCERESALLVTLPPGAYTAILCSSGGGRLADSTLACGSQTGVGLIEVFEVSAQGTDVTLSATSILPGRLLTVTGAQFDASKQTFVVFGQQGGADTRVLARSVTASTVEVVVPFLFNRQSFELASGSVSVTVVQESAGASVSFRSRDNLQIGVLPQTTASPGAITLDVLDQLQSLLGSAIESYSTIETASQGAVNTSQLRDRLRTMQRRLLDSQLLIEQVVNGQAQRTVLGRMSGAEVFLDRDALTLLDRLLTAYLVAERTSATTPGRELSADASPTTVRDVFRDFTCGVQTTEVFQAATRVRGALGAGIGALTLLATIPTGPVALKFGALAGAVNWFTTTATPVAIIVLAQSGCAAIFGDVEPDVVQRTLNGIRDSSTDFLISVGIDKAGGLTGPLGELGGSILNLTRDVAQTLGTDLTPQILARLQTVRANRPRAGTQPTATFSSFFSFLSGLPVHASVIGIRVSGGPPGGIIQVTSSWGASASFVLDVVGRGVATVRTPNHTGCFTGTVTVFFRGASIGRSSSSCFAPADVHSSDATASQTAEPPEVVNDFETPTSRIYCRTSAVATASRGGLIQTAAGSAGGSGGLRTKRSGCAA